MLFRSSGPCIITTLNSKKRRELVQYIGDVLENIIQEKKIDICKVSSANLSEYCLLQSHSYTNPWHEFRSDWTNEAIAYYYLDLSCSTDIIKSNLETRARTIINKFEKITSVEIKKATEMDIDIIYNLFIQTSNRAGLPIHSKENFIWWLNFNYCEHYIAYVGGVPACVIRLLKYKNTALYSAGFTANDYVKHDIATYLLWQCIIMVKENGGIHFEIGIEEFKSVGKWDNISKFKRSFGGVLRYKFNSVYERESIAKKALRKILNIL